MPHIAILGRSPALSIAELESVFGAKTITIVQNHIVSLDHSEDIELYNTLGGVQKVGKILTILDTTDWRKITSYIKKTLPDHLRYIPEGKITLGLSVYGVDSKVKAINATALELKKTVKAAGRSVRVVPNDNLELNTAKTLHNKLTSPNGLELLIIRDGRKTILAQAIWVQDIEAYAKRDQARPKRDARVGMLPPKLAQTIINLARPGSGSTLLDPFCGTGVLLQEALLMGVNIIGSDLEPRMIEYSQDNLSWLGFNDQTLLVADATTHTWKENFNTIACETYLGRPLSSLPDPDTLHKVMQDCATIHKKFLQNVARQTKKGFRLCIAVPAWHTGQGFKHLATLDHLKELGYNRVSFVHVDTAALIYHRQGQIVARELVVLERT